MSTVLTNTEVQSLLDEITLMKARHAEELRPLEGRLLVFRKACVHRYEEKSVVGTNGIDIAGMTHEQRRASGSIHPYRVTQVCSHCGEVYEYDDY